MNTKGCIFFRTNAKYVSMRHGSQDLCFIFTDPFHTIPAQMIELATQACVYKLYNIIHICHKFSRSLLFVNILAKNNKKISHPQKISYFKTSYQKKIKNKKNGNQSSLKLKIFVCS